MQAGSFLGDVDQALQRDGEGGAFGGDAEAALRGGAFGDAVDAGEALDEGLVAVEGAAGRVGEGGGDEIGLEADGDVHLRAAERMSSISVVTKVISCVAAGSMRDWGREGQSVWTRRLSLPVVCQSSSVRKGMKGWRRIMDWSRTQAMVARVSAASGPSKRGLANSTYQSQTLPQTNL